MVLMDQESQKAQTPEPIAEAPKPVAETPETSPVQTQVSESVAEAPEGSVAIESVPAVNDEGAVEVSTSTQEQAPQHGSNVPPQEKDYGFGIQPLFSMYWQDTDYRRINEGLAIQFDLCEASTAHIKNYFSHMENNGSDTLNRNSTVVGATTRFNEHVEWFTEFGINAYDDAVGEAFTTSQKITYRHDNGNIAFEYSHYDIIDTVEIFTPRYYSLVTSVDAARHKIATNDYKLEAYQQLDAQWALYGNIAYGDYSDGNVKRTAYISPIYYLDQQWSLKYAFAYVDVRDFSPLYFSHQDSKVHQAHIEYLKQLSEQWVFNTEAILSYDIDKGIGVSTYLALGYQIKKNMRYDVAVTYSYATDNDANNDLHSVYFSTSLKSEF